MADKKKNSAKEKDKPAGKLIAENRRARYDYFIQEDVEAGIVLTGTEVKSLRMGRATISDAHAGEMQGELYIFNVNIPEYVAGNRNNHEPKRPKGPFPAESVVLAALAGASA